MKKLLLVLMALTLVAGFATISSAGIASTPHDFSSEVWSNATNEICKVCHTPHNALSPQLIPLWNHEETSTVFAPLYSSDTFDGGPAGQPGGVSKACLSCHDGTIAINAYGTYTTAGLGINAVFVTGSALLDTDLSDDHPISFTYDDALAGTDGGLYTPSTQLSGLGGTIQNDMLFGDSLECASCHDPHDNSNLKFLVKSNVGSALCLTCHDK